jgi:hypothetical protein
MRALPALLVLAFAAPTALAEVPISLSARDVKVSLRPHADTIERCYTDHTAEVYGAGRLSIELTITRQGSLETVAIKAPGLDTKVGVKVAGCIVDTLDNVSFPKRRAKTTATIPYFFQRTYAVGAGPIEPRYARAGWRVQRHASSARSRVSRHADATH